MNTLYRLVYNTMRDAWMCVAETTRSHQKSTRARPRLAALAVSAALSALAAASSPALAAPERCASNAVFELSSGVCSSTHFETSGAAISGMTLNFTDAGPVQAKIEATNDLNNWAERFNPFSGQSTLIAITGDLSGKSMASLEALEDSATLHLEGGRFRVSAPVSANYTAAGDVHRALVLSSGLFDISGNIGSEELVLKTATHGYSATRASSVPTEAWTVYMNSNAYARFSGNVIGTRAEGAGVNGQSGLVLFMGNIAQIAGSVSGGASDSGRGGAAIETTGSTNRIILERGSRILGGAGSTASTAIVLGSGNTLELWGTLGSEVTITGAVTSTGANTLALGGIARDTQTLDLSVLSTGGALATAGFNKIEVDSAGTWALTGMLNDRIRDIDFTNGTLDLTGVTGLNGALTIDAFKPAAFVATDLSAFRRIDSDTLTMVGSDTSGHRTLKLAGTLAANDLTIAASDTTLNIDKNFTVSGTLTLNAGSNTTLETNLTEAGSSGVATPTWLTQFLRSTAANRTLVSTDLMTLGRELDLSALAAWRIEGGAKVLDASKLAARNTVAAGKTLTLANFNAATFKASGKALEATDATLAFAGRTQLDAYSAEELGALAATRALVVDEALVNGETVLVTGKTTGAALAALTATLTGLDQATLETSDSYDDGESGVPQSFKKWLMLGENNNAAGFAADRTIISEGSTLTSSANSLTTDQTLEVNGTFIFDALAVSGALETGAGASSTLIKRGTGEASLSGEQAVRGTLTVEDGTLTLPNTSLANLAVTVNEEATLGVGIRETESGTSSALRRVPRSTPLLTEFSELNISGTYAMDVESATRYSQTHASNTITINDGSTLLINISGLTESATLTSILSADNGISGRFSRLTSNSVLFDFEQEFVNENHALDLKLTLKNSPTTPTEPEEPTPPTGPTEPEQPEEPTVPANPSTPTLVEIVREAGFERAEDAARVLDALITEDANRAADLGLLANSTSRDALARAVVGTLPSLSGTTNAAIAEQIALMSDAPAFAREACSAESGPELWARLLGERATQSADHGAAGYRADTEGLAAGGNVCVRPGVRAGLSAAYTHATLTERGSSATSQRVKTDSWLLGSYAEADLTDALMLDARLYAGRATLKGERTLSFVGREAVARSTATLFTAGTGLNWTMPLSAMRITPFVRLDYTLVDTRGYQETGAGALNLRVEDQRSEQLISRVGVKLATPVSDALTLNVKTALGYDLLARGRALTASFAAFEGSTFRVENTRQGRLLGELGLGLAWQVSPSVTLEATLDAQARSGYSAGAASSTVRWRF